MVVRRRYRWRFTFNSLSRRIGSVIDLEYIRGQRAQYEKSLEDRGLKPAAFELDKILALADERKKLVQQTDAWRAERNMLAKQKTASDRGKQIKAELKALETKLTETEAILRDLELKLPNIVHPDMPIGKSPADNKVIKEWGSKPGFDFKPKDHVELGKALDLIDLEASARVSGSRFYFLKNELVLMQLALFGHVMKKLVSRGYTPIIPPVLVKARALEGTGYFPFENSQIYEVKTAGKIEEGEPLYLAGTSEQAIVAYHENTVFKPSELPKKYVGLSPCFRSEVGSWGKDVKGIRRVHQFDKVEMILFTTPADSQKEMLGALALEEEILQDLGLAYRVIDMCTGDVGLPTYRKFDVEVWLPSANEYMEVMSNSDLHEFHARRLNIKYKTAAGESAYVHTVSATAITNTRPLLAILENFQQADGSVKVPKILQPAVGKDLVKPKI